MERQTRDQNWDWGTRAELDSRSRKLAYLYSAGSCGDHSACSAAAAIDDFGVGEDIGSGSLTTSFDG